MISGLHPLVLGASFLVVCAALVVAIAEFQNRRKLYSLRGASRNERKGFADLLVYASLVAPGIVLNKDGALMAGWRLRGEDAATKSAAELAQRVAYLNQAFAQRNVGWMFHYDKIRIPANPPPEQTYFRTATERVLGESRRAAAEAEGERFESRDVLVAVYLPPSDLETRAKNWLFTDRKVREYDLEPVISSFEAGLAQIEDSLRPIMLGLHRLSVRETVDGQGQRLVVDELVEHLNFCINGVEDPITTPCPPVLLNAFLASQGLCGGFRPRVGRKHLRTITLCGFPHESWPTMLDQIATLGIPHRFSSRAIVEDAHKAREILRRSFSDWFGKRTGLATKILTEGPRRISRDAEDMVDDVEEAQRALDRGLVKYLWYSGSIVLMDEDERQVDAWAHEIQKTLSHAGFPNRTEDWLAVDAFLGTLPGDGYHNIRKYTLHSLNVGDLLPTTSIWGGRRELSCSMCPAGVEPVAYVKTRSNDYFALDPHQDDVMHTFVGGPTGNGKTALVNFLMANFIKGPGDQAFGIDYQYGQHRTCEMLGGEYYDIGVDDSGLQLCPLRDVDLIEERRWAVDWIETLVELNGVRVTPDDHARIARAMDLLALSPNRSLTTFTQKLSDPDGRLRAALKPYTLGGVLGAILDGEADALSGGRFQVYELSHIMPLKEKAVVPVLLLLFHRIEQRLTGARTLIAVEEAWLYLQHPVFAPKLRQWLKTLRKLHAGVIFVTQQLGDVFGSPLCDPILESCKTKILLPNIEADGVTREFYRRVGLSDHQIANLARAIPKRDYWFHSSDGCAMIDLALGPEELAVVGAGSPDDVRLTRLLKQQFPDDYPARIFETGGFEQAARRWRELAGQILSAEPGQNLDIRDRDVPPRGGSPHPLLRKLDMINKASLIGLALAALLCVTNPASAQWVVNDPQNALILISQRLNQLKQIDNEVKTLEYQLRNLRSYAQNWQQIRGEITTLRAAITQSRSKVADAKEQLAQMDSELATVDALQQMSNGAQGQLQATQTTNMLVAQLVSQLQKQRAMTAVAALDEQRNYDEAYRQLYPAVKSALQGRL
jgi:type IV secretion system protein VirB4